MTEDRGVVMAGYGHSFDRDAAEPEIQARCAWCGTVELGAEEFEVHVGSGTDALFQFDCPNCTRFNVGPLEGPDLATLLAAGLHPTGGIAPFELLEEHSGPPISWDDLIDFHQAMAQAGSRWKAMIENRGRSPEQERDAA